MGIILGQVAQAVIAPPYERIVKSVLYTDQSGGFNTASFVTILEVAAGAGILDHLSLVYNASAPDFESVRITIDGVVVFDDDLQDETRSPFIDIDSGGIRPLVFDESLKIEANSPGANSGGYTRYLKHSVRVFA